MSMTEIAFHFNAPQKVSYACKLLRKAANAGARVAVLGDAGLLARLDAELWTFSALDFVAHLHAPLLGAAADLTPVVLCDTPDQSPHSQVLVNLTDAVPAGFERFARLIEVVSNQEADRQAARKRWKQYTDLGYQIVRYDLTLSPD